jgi:hypothetical protein
MDMAMPVLLLFFWQLLKNLLCDYILNPYEPCIWLITFIDDALVHIFIQVGTVVMSGDLLAHVPRVEMETTDMHMDTLKRCKLLQSVRTCL